MTLARPDPSELQCSNDCSVELFENMEVDVNHDLMSYLVSLNPVQRDNSTTASLWTTGAETEVEFEVGLYSELLD